MVKNKVFIISFKYSITESTPQHMAIYAVKEMGSMQAGYCSIGHGPDIVKCWAMEDMLRGSRLVASGD